MKPTRRGQRRAGTALLTIEICLVVMIYEWHSFELENDKARLEGSDYPMESHKHDSSQKHRNDGGPGRGSSPCSKALLGEI